MELQPGEEPKATPVQPATAADPVTVFDVTKKPKKEISAKHRAQLDAARQSRIAKRRAEKEALAQEGGMGGPPVMDNATVGAGGSAPPSGSVGGDGGSVAGHDAGPEVASSEPAASTTTQTAVAEEGAPPAKRHCPSGAPASGGGCSDSIDSASLDLPAGGGASSTVGEPVAEVKVIDDPLISAIRAGKKKPMLWSCEGLESLVEYKPPKGKNTE